MGVYGKRCLGFIKENCWGTMRLEVSIGAPHFTVKLINDTPIVHGCTTI